jgi:hypothetical protein
MKPHLEPGPGLLCIVIVVTIAAVAIAGCLGTTPDTQDTAPAVPDRQVGNNAAGTAVMTATTKAPAVPVTSPSLPAKDPSARFITIDPIGTKNLGDLLVISGTTNLPEKTAIYISRAYGNAGEAVTWANSRVRSGTDGTNHWRFVFDTSGFRPGSYTLTVATGKKGVSGAGQFTLTGTFLGTDNPVYYSGSTGARSAGTPIITVQPPGDRQQGDVFLITGTTTLDEGTILLYQVYPDYFDDPSKRSPSSAATPSSIAGDTIVIRGTGTTNRWSCALDTEGYEKTAYIVNVSTISEDNTQRKIFGSAPFTLR